jgi:dimethylargininase
MQSRSLFHFTHAVCRAIDPSLVTAALRLGEPSSSAAAHVVDLATARRQHDAMVAALKRVGVSTVLELPSDGLPDSVFVEDTAVFGANDGFFITLPGAPSRRLETAGVKQALDQHFRGAMTVQRQGTLDGGDVLFTGREYFVGRSQRTDDAGIDALRRAFPSHPVTAIDVQHGVTHGVLHLKSACSMGGDGHIVTGGPVGEHIRRAVEAAAPGRYTFTHVPDAAAANCVYVNGHLLRRRYTIAHPLFPFRTRPLAPSFACLMGYIS